MASTYFEIDIALRETDTGNPVLTTTAVLDDLDWTFVLVDERRGKALIAIEASLAEASELAAGKELRKLTKAELTNKASSYRTPCLKREYEEAEVDEDAEELPKPALVLKQTLRSGYRLVDVPVDPRAVASVVLLPPGPATEDG